MAVFSDPKRASRALIAFGTVLLGVSAKFATDSVLPVIAGYIGFVMLVRGIWLAWKYRKLDR